MSGYSAVVMLCMIGGVKQRREVTRFEHASCGESLGVTAGPRHCQFVLYTHVVLTLTGVRSRLSSSVAEAAASIRSSHRFPMIAAADAGSAENAFRS